MIKPKKSVKKRATTTKTSKKKSTAKFKEANDKKKNREIVGLFLIFFGFLSVVSLISMFNFFGDRITSTSFGVYPYINILGSFGDFLLFAFVNTFGSKLSFVAAFGIIILGYNLIRGKEKKLLIFRSIFISAVVFFLAIIFSIPSMKPLENIDCVRGGGIIGHLVVNNIFIPFFQTKTFGPYMIMGFVLLLWLVVGTPLSFNVLFEGFELKVRTLSSKIFALILSIIGKIKEKGEQIGSNIAYSRTKPKPRFAELPHNESSRSNSFNSENSSTANDENIDDDLSRFNDILNKMDAKKEKKPIFNYKDDIISGEIIDDDIDIETPFEFENEKSDNNRTKSFFDNNDDYSDDDETFDFDTTPTPDDEDDTENIYEVNIKTKESTKYSENVKITEVEGIDPSDIKISKKEYTLPPIDLLGMKKVERNISEQTLRANGTLLLEKLANFKVTGKIINIIPGPVITRYEIKLDPHIQVSKVAKFADDLAMALEAQSIIIQAPIPGKNAIGIDVPNQKREIVYFREIIEDKAFQESKFILPFAIGQNVDGSNIVTGLEKLPHLLIAGQTGAGKSVGLNTIIMSLLYSQTPDQCKLILIDPKKVEFTIFQDIPHLLTPVVTEPEDALAALNWITAEMDDRYRILSKVGVRNIEGYNIKAKKGQFPLSPQIPEKYWKSMNYIVLVVDELADLMMLAGKEVEAAIQRIAQLARAVGIHLIVATQRPSVNVITGVIKANLPSRIAFKTPTVIDSRTILDSGGAEKLLGMGDMLFYKTGALAGAERIHGAFITDEEAEKIALFVSQQRREGEEPERIPDEFKKKDDSKGTTANVDSMDDKIKEAAKLAIEQGELSATFLQRRLSIGFARAGKMVDELELLGIVGPKKGSKAREVLVGEDYIESDEWNMFFG